MEQDKDGSSAFELEDIARPRDVSNHLYSSDHGDLRNSSSTLGDDLDDPTTQIGKERFIPYTSDEERAVIKKLDRNLVLFVAFLYMLSFLDRSSTSPAFT